MAFVRASIEIDGGADTFVDVPLPRHSEGDVVFVSVVQDATSGSFTLPGAPWQTLYDFLTGGSHMAVIAAVAPAGGLEDVTVVSSILDGWAAGAVVVGDADPSFLDNSAGKTGVYPQDTPSLDSLTDNCLLATFFGADQGGLVQIDPSDATVTHKISAGAVLSMSAVRQLGAAGPVPTFTVESTITDTVHIYSLTIKNATNGGLQPRGGLSIRHYENFGASLPTPSSMVSVVGSTIDGVTTQDYTFNGSVNSTAIADRDWGNVMTVGGIESPINVENKFIGGMYSIPTMDFTNAITSIRFFWPYSANYHGPKGWLVILVDALGNWSAHTLLFRGDATVLQFRTVCISFDAESPLDGSATPPDLTQITAIGFAYQRLKTTSTQNRAVGIKDLTVWNYASLTGGNEYRPCSLVDLASVFEGAGRYDVLSKQGSGQLVHSVALRIGDGSSRTVFSGSARSAECRLLSNITRRSELLCGITVHAGPDDVIDMGGTIVASATRERFDFHPSSSPSASYNFAGATFSGYEVELISGITLNGASLLDSYEVTQNGGSVVECFFDGCKGSACIVSDDPSLISGCEFSGSLNGHAIEITTPGTYTFSGNTFSGYGADGTTDAAIYNNSGGAVTLNITGGGDTPTVRNGAGASTTIVSGATLTLTGLQAGSDIVILEAGTTTERVNVDANAGTTYAYAYTATGDVDIGVFKAGFVPFYIRGFTLNGVNASLPIAQVPDRAYSNP